MDWFRVSIFMVFLLLLSSCSRSSEQVQGYIEGDYTYVATSVSGVLVQLLVDKGMQVKKGQLLFVLEPQPESDAYDAALENYNQSVAARDAISANLEYARITYQRYKLLVPKNAIEKSQLDNAQANHQALLAQLAQANANIASSKATLAQAKWTKNQKNIYTPVDALVFSKFYNVGEFTLENQPILSLLAPENIKVIFYVKAPVLGRIQLNDKISVQCDGCETSFQGRITFISPSAEYTPPVIYSSETNAKLVFRIEGKFTPEVAKKLHPGQPVYVMYYAHDK